MRVLVDFKSGYVSVEAEYQLGAYAKGFLTPTTPLPDPDEGLILKVHDKGYEEIWLTKARLTECGELFAALKRVWDDQYARGLVKLSDYYDIDGTQYPRVTAILKLLNKPSLNGWQVKNAVQYTLQECISRDAKAVHEAFTSGRFDPTTASRTRMEARGGEGRALHHAIHTYLTGGQPSLDSPWLSAAFTHFLTWVEKRNVKLYHGLSEKRVVLPTDRCAGTLDCMVELEKCEER